MLDGNLISQALQSGATGMLEYLLNIGGEIAVIEKVVLLIIAPTIGLMISVWGVFDFMKMKNPRYQSKVSPASVIIRFCIGPATIQLALLMTALSHSIYGRREIQIHEGMATSYVDSAQSTADPVAAGLLIVTAFLVMVGWIAALRAMMAWSRAGDPSENGYQLFKTGAARMIAATVLCSFQFFMDDMFESASGQAGSFSSSLDLPN